MLANFGGWHFLIIALVVLLIFGATRLPALAKSLGQSVKILKKETRAVDDDDPVVAESDTATPTSTDSAAVARSVSEIQ